MAVTTSATQAWWACEWKWVLSLPPAPPFPLLHLRTIKITDAVISLLRRWCGDRKSDDPNFHVWQSWARVRSVISSGTGGGEQGYWLIQLCHHCAQNSNLSSVVMWSRICGFLKPWSCHIENQGSHWSLVTIKWQSALSGMWWALVSMFCCYCCFYLCSYLNP